MGRRLAPAAGLELHPGTGAGGLGALGGQPLVCVVVLPGPPTARSFGWFGLGRFVRALGTRRRHEVHALQLGPGEDSVRVDVLQPLGVGGDGLSGAPGRDAGTGCARGAGAGGRGDATGRGRAGV